jgi:hypothetical protein
MSLTNVDLRTHQRVWATLPPLLGLLEYTLVASMTPQAKVRAHPYGSDGIVILVAQGFAILDFEYWDDLFQTIELLLAS